MNVSRGRLAGGRSILLPGICLSLVLALTPASWGAPGDEVWVNRYKGPGRSIDNARALGVSPDGARVFVTGSSQGSAGQYDYDYATVAHDAATGAELWAKRYNGPGNFFDHAIALGVSPDGATVFVTGYGHGSASDVDYATVAYDAATGAELWVKGYNGPGNKSDWVLALGVSPDGGSVFVTGNSDGSSSSYDYATVAYDAATGAELWVKRYDGPRKESDHPHALGVSPDGATVFVTGSSAGSGARYHYATVAYDAATGAELWAKGYNAPGRTGSDLARALGVSPDGATVFVTGSSYELGSQEDYATVAYDAATGARLWVERYDGPGNASDSANALGVSLDGASVFVTGASHGSRSQEDYATVAYDAATGAELWVKRFKGPGDDSDLASALGVSPDGASVFVTGSSYGSGSQEDYATVAHDAATGARLWVKSYNGPGNGSDLANALGVSPDGARVFVTGSSDGAAGHPDYATVAYEA